MFYLIHGNDTYRSREKLREIIDAYRNVNRIGLSFFEVDLEEESFEDVEYMLGSSSLFPEKKLLVLKSASANKEFQQRFADSTKKVSLVSDKDTIIIFFERQTIPLASPLFALVKKFATIQRCDVPRGAERKEWVKRYVEARGCKIEPKALESFIGSTDSLDTWGMKNELDKIIHYSTGPFITEGDIALFLRASLEVKIFTVLDALGERNKKSALASLEHLLSEGESEVYILTMIVYGFRNLLRVKSLEDTHTPSFLIGKKLKLHPYVFRKTLAQARRFSIEELKKIYQKLARIDLEIKVGRVDPRLALEMFVTSV